MPEDDQAVESYRIDQLEKELEKLKSEYTRLSFEQIKQMFAWLGLPVAIATGVFGLALWQSIEIGAVTVAEQRADGKVSEITGKIDNLGRRVADLAARAQSTIEEMARIQGRAEGAALDVRKRADEASERVVLAERELTNLKGRIAGVPDVVSLTDSIESAASGLAGNEDFQDLVASKAIQGLQGVVAAFDIESGCPPGWIPFSAAAGRAIIGAGTGEQTGARYQEIALTPRDFRDFGGEEMHKLTVQEMPSHAHKLPGGGRKPSHILDGTTAPGSGKLTYGMFDDERPDSKAVGDQPHNNMPPYIALYFCKKLPLKIEGE